MSYNVKIIKADEFDIKSYKLRIYLKIVKGRLICRNYREMWWKNLVKLRLICLICLQMGWRNLEKWTGGGGIWQTCVNDGNLYEYPVKIPFFES